ncbi:MAG TPA: O-antigen ligase family protein [Candidatus Limnocylindria bacterium]|nr:O-antigen ligase family protein [Candidatus Limnocylindria bacterium]
MPNLLLSKLLNAKILFFLFLASLFFPVRHIFLTPEAFQTGAFSDFTSIPLYLSDILLFSTVLACLLPRGGEDSPRDTRTSLLQTTNYPLLTLILWLFLGILYHFSSLTSQNWFFFAKFLELIVAYGTTALLFSKTDIKGLFIKFFVIFSSFESLLALWQFRIQTSVGGVLHKLGESVLSPDLPGVAKIVSSGTTLIRGYGTFPHPNLLSAFLMVGVLMALYLLLRSTDLKYRIIYSLAILINILGLTVTFSRASYLALAIGLIIFFGFIFWRHSEGVQPTEGYQIRNSLGGLRLNPLIIVLFSIFISFLIFRPYLSTRATITDTAATERALYSKIGLQMVKQNPIFGVGVGESVLKMNQYSQVNLLPWQVQPIHNYFLLAAAELGIPGALILIFIFLWHLKSLILNLKFKFSPYSLLLTSLLLSFLILMLFDHYFYTLQQTQMLLWIILGVIGSEIKNPSHEGSLKS